VGAVGLITRTVIAVAMIVATLSGCKDWPSAYANYPPGVNGSNRGGRP
jgi:hypothetical protein